MHNKVNLINKISLSSSDKARGISLEKTQEGVLISNSSSSYQIITICNLVHFNKKGFFLCFTNEGLIEKGECSFHIDANQIPLNANAEIKLSSIKLSQINLRLKPNTKVLIRKIEYSIEKNSNFKDYKSSADTLVISPGYPNSGNLYHFGFVHTSTKAYISSGMNVDIFCDNHRSIDYNYEFDGSKVFYSSLVFLKGLIHRSNYKRVIIHFIDEKLKDIIDSVILYYGIKVYIYIHGAETLYHNQRKMCTTYDGIYTPDVTNEKINRLDAMFEKFANSRNIKWFFVSKWMIEESERLLNVKFLNSEVIHNGIDTTIFKYHPKTAQDRLNIFTIRRFDDINKYAIDLVVGTILALQKKEFFDELTFYIYGDGPLFERFASMVPFQNVKFIRGFFTHKQISELHKKCGIALHPTRLDSMGCSSLEAVCSGLVLISSNTAAIPEFTDPQHGTLSDDIENPFSYASIIEDLYYNPSRFLELSEKMSTEASSRLSRDKILAKELSFFKNEQEFYIESSIANGNKILSICVPAYNIEKYLPRCLNSLLSCHKKDLLELIIVNDGSTDNTLQVALNFREKYPNIITLINKENGGHGSAVLVGIENATSKYFRIVDGDDWVDSRALDKLIQSLQLVDVDLVLTDYSIDRIEAGNIELILAYKHLPKGQMLQFDNLTFEEYGPILPTATYATSLLKGADITLPEKCLYTDTEFNARAIVNVNSLIYFNLSVYRYFVGRADQSISASCLHSKYKDSVKVTFNILSFVTQNKLLTFNKRQYIVNKILLPVVILQLRIHIVVLRKYREAIIFYSKIISLNNKSTYKVNLPIVKLLLKGFIKKVVVIIFSNTKRFLLIPHSIGKYSLAFMRMHNIHYFDKYARKIDAILLLPIKIASYIKKILL